MPLSKDDRAWRAVGAGCFGALLGVLLGLSVTPVVSVAVTAGFALVGGIVGFAASKRGDGGEGTEPSRPSGLLVAALSAGCIAGIGAGVHARTHRLLEPSLDERMAELQTETGLDQEAARQLVLLERFGSTARHLVAEERIRGTKTLVDSLVEAGFAKEQALEIVGARLRAAAEQPVESEVAAAGSGSTVLFMSEQDQSKCEERAEIVFESEEQMRTILGEFEDVRVRSIPARVDTLGLGAAEKLVVARAMLRLACDFGTGDEE